VTASYRSGVSRHIGSSFHLTFPFLRTSQTDAIIVKDIDVVLHNHMPAAELRNAYARSVIGVPRTKTRLCQGNGGQSAVLTLAAFSIVCGQTFFDLTISHPNACDFSQLQVL
jgi:hypothetical protein